MLLAKSCAKSYNIKKGTIKLGTLHEYRMTEKKEIADRQEGMLTFSIIFDGTVKITSKWLNILAGGGISIGHTKNVLRFPGKTNLSTRGIHVISVDNDSGTAIVKNTNILISRESPNSFVFCMSYIQNKNDCLEIFKEYDDYWYINSESIESFGKLLAQDLLKKIYDSHFTEDPIIPKTIDIDDVVIHFEHDHIAYLTRETHITGDSVELTEEFINKLYNMAFIKPESYKHEKEYRFSFTVIANNKVIEPIKKSIVLDSSRLLHLII